MEAHREGNFNGIDVSQHLQITHLLFVDDVLIFCSGTVHDMNTLAAVLALFSSATGMEINERKSTLTTHRLDDAEVGHPMVCFPFLRVPLDDGLKYLGFFLKPNNYLKKDLVWLIEKLEKILHSWSHRWLSRARRLVLVKAMLEAIQV